MCLGGTKKLIISLMSMCDTINDDEKCGIVNSPISVFFFCRVRRIRQQKQSDQIKNERKKLDIAGSGGESRQIEQKCERFLPRILPDSLPPAFACRSRQVRQNQIFDDERQTEQRAKAF